MSVHLFGIRHHGPGSARSLLHALQALQPDHILIEGPPDADHLIPLVADTGMKPPVALLLYRPDEPQQAVYYPFATFSPEWQAMHFGLAHEIPVQFMDLPQKHQLAPDLAEAAEPAGNEDSAAPIDPLSVLATAAGFDDGEAWWEHLVEQRLNHEDLFAGILSAMSAVRQEVTANALPGRDAHRETLREAHMRQCIRAAARQAERVAVVCGAWHTPALAEMPPARADAAHLRRLPKVKINATWVPWSYARLAYHSGYGAGIHAPGWYEHLWQMGADGAGDPLHLTTAWLTKVARHLRREDIPAPSANIIDASRLALTLAALRQRPLPALTEMNEAVRTVLCHGEATPLRIIEHDLIIGERLGAVPAHTPMVPLQTDLTRLQKRLRLKPTAREKLIDLDLRKPVHRERSLLLHRLTILGVPWGQRQEKGPVQAQGTFHEFWHLAWQPDLAVRLIEASIWGTTVAAAATNLAQARATETTDLTALGALLDQALLADLGPAVPVIMKAVQTQAALATDITQLMGALPPLVNVLRYGDVRRTNQALVAAIVDGLITRICLGLPAATVSLDDEAARHMLNTIQETQRSISRLTPARQERWHTAIADLTRQSGGHGLIAGYAHRLLLDAGQFDQATIARAMTFALSNAARTPVTTEATGSVEAGAYQAAAWIEGFLSGSGLLLLHDDTLWRVVDQWLIQLPSDAFAAILPLLRRTFAAFAPAERRQLGGRARQPDTSAVASPASDPEIDHERAKAILPFLAAIMQERDGDESE